MLHFQRITTVLVFVLAALSLPHATQAADWELIWWDEFDGSSLDLTKWTPQTGTGCPSLCGWGNNELQFYRAENATVAGGMLTIEAREENYGGRAYTSARLRTINQGDFLYGRMEMRARLPIGQGLWPAFWMLPTDNIYGGWAASGEIDIMEILGQQPNKLYGTIHHGGSYPDNTSSGQTYILPSGDFNADFHTFALEWEPTEIRWYLDGQLYSTQTNWYSAGQPFPAPFDERFHLLMNVAVGGNFPGAPDGSTVFPQQMIVDYVRVYRDARDCEVVYDSMDHGSPFANGWFSFNGSVGGGGIEGNTTDVAPGVGETASLATGWGSGGTPGFVGGFGRSRDFDIAGFTHFEFWINPDAGQSYVLELNLQDDDNGDGIISLGPDDEFQYNLTVGGPGSDAIAGGGWQKISIPFTSFYDDNSYWNGGNGVLDAVATQSGGNGMLVSVVAAMISQSGADISFRTDRWAFIRPTASITGTVWEDMDGDGVQDDGEPGIPGVTVEVLEDAAVFGSTTTLGNGSYQFDALIAGSFDVRIDASSLPDNLIATFDPDGMASPDEFSVQLDCDHVVTGGDFGYRQAATGAPPSIVRQDRLYGANPNPFNPRTVLRFDLASAGHVELVVYDTQGRLVRKLESREWPAGTHEAEWDGVDATGRLVASGVYFAQLQTARGRSVTRMVLLK